MGPGWRELGAADDAGLERQLWRWFHTAAAPGCVTKDPGLAPARPGVHSADMNDPAIEAPSADRWNATVLLLECVVFLGLWEFFFP